MRSTISGYTRLPLVHKLSTAGIAAAGVAAVAFAAVPASADSQALDVKPVAWTATATAAAQDQVRDELAQRVAGAAAQAKTDAAAAQKASADAAAKAKADKERGEKETASRSEERKPVKAAPAPAPAAPAPAAAPVKKAYADNLDGWINEAIDILRAKGIPASFEGVKRNIMRESTGNPRAINNWDSNAAAGIPSKGLLQIIDPTFKAYHVEGTSWDIYDPVANIAASCNYAADKYGSMDNVNSAY
ncbi:transglycosylase SLT domain-containing protein [Streptomyces albireticuli]|uniref:Lytic transglycosylase n=1 Tax=Streptomyces albireticuli TaxID=1940 RepID=A0A2A2CYV5_9ACTN|nr:transglycosylase SLT domain-containing protein [Streptomyces albireticuli]MCD9145627.1 transglycosylase SLT domain-containing protein [Streptomyces albireticuli]MCD9165641.1 transglycosylase SLT domain-containing protein [Streptomyces albireticuli]MCD9196627.1 transglycosylase SLT domain-containing protein [Streptomyces albireticuli]PAU44387.1 lytic transglycosylase [Streptomyces albireticuli]